MKKLGAGLAALGIALMMAGGCNSSDDDAKSTIDADYNTRATEALVREVRVGMTQQEVRELLGDRNRNIPMSDPREEGWLYNWGPGVANETAVVFVDGKVAFLPWIDGKPQ